MTIHLLDDTLCIEVFYECEDHDLEDNVCISVVETCPASEQLFRAGETHIFLTSAEARLLGEALLAAAGHSETNKEEQGLD